MDDVAVIPLFVIASSYGMEHIVSLWDGQTLCGNQFDLERGNRELRTGLKCAVCEGELDRLLGLGRGV